MRAVLLAAAASTMILSGCNPDTASVATSLGSEPPADDASTHGYVIEPVDIGDFNLQSIRQIGALYYVHGGAALSATRPTSIGLSCAVIAADDPPEIVVRHPKPYDINTKIGGSIATPAIFKHVLGGITIDASTSHTVALKVSNLTYETLDGADLRRLKKTLSGRRKCAEVRAGLPKQVRPTIFQLVGVASADVSGTITNVSTGKAALLAGNLTPIDASGTATIDWKQTAFKVYKAVGE